MNRGGKGKKRRGREWRKRKGN